MVAHRQEDYYNDINTNNLIESWHRTLKMKFLRDRRHSRVDRVVYCLVHHAVPFYMRKVKIDKVEAGEKSSERLNELCRVKQAEAFMAKWRLDENKGSPIMQIDKTTLHVPSIPVLKPLAKSSEGSGPSSKCSISANLSSSPQGTPQFYEVKINWPARAILSCTCPYFFRNRNKCKHIALAIIDIHCVEFVPPPCYVLLPGSALKSLPALDGEEEEEDADYQEEEEEDGDEDVEEDDGGSEEEEKAQESDSVQRQLARICLDLESKRHEITKAQADAIEKLLKGEKKKHKAAVEPEGPDAHKFKRRRQ